MSKEVEIKSVPSLIDDSARLVYYRLKSPYFFERLFARKGFLKKSYRITTGYKILFDPDEYAELVEHLKTYDDVEAWRKQQKSLQRQLKYNTKAKWDKI